MKNKKLTTYQMAVTALMAAALCVLGPLSVPIGAIPISLSNFVICLTAWLLGPKFGTLSVAVYLLIGLVGVPVFSGYGAGIAAPGWYEHLWLSGVAFDASPATAPPRTVGWLARVARLMRERDLDCSSAHLIEATRLADTLAALRQRYVTSPVRVITARYQLGDRVRGLDGGAEDYIVKPVEAGELGARLRAVLCCPVQKALRRCAVHHVVGQAARAQHAGRHRHRVAGQAAGAGVDNHVKTAVQ